MNSKDSQGCGELGYSGATMYPDLICWDGYMIDADADCYDPNVTREPCKQCNSEEHLDYLMG